ncbi:hypothetical protein FA15DRAFT_760864 [Coprinopsis marcescibilis]|uniref:RNase H type-1 domain-containing protein n=1 Tax=Coprinopsis marcescibilis TaxID=230819 RepID=A0A5C3KD62_COPMA|nr:hypothetical protein FA15DRAFT_760864 [Coprinopsis marcescibilis]
MPISLQLHTQPLSDEDPSPASSDSLPLFKVLQTKTGVSTPAPLPRRQSNSSHYRFITKNTTKRTQALFFIDGACTDNGAPAESQRPPRGGAAVVFSPLAHFKPLQYPLELDGQKHTSNRAELRAALIALTLRFWPGEGFDNVVLTTDSEKTAAGKPIANRDLWQAILKAVRRLDDNGCHAQFWLIPRDWNEADAYAKKAATLPDTQRERGSSTNQVRIMERGTENAPLLLNRTFIEKLQSGTGGSFPLDFHVRSPGQTTITEIASIQAKVNAAGELILQQG